MKEFSGIFNEMLWTGITMYGLSIFAGFFDKKIGTLLKLVAYLNGLSIILLVGMNAWAFINRLMMALENFKLF